MSLRNPGETYKNISRSPVSAVSSHDQNVPTNEAIRSRNENLTASPKIDEYRNMIRHILNKISKRRRPPTTLANLAEQSRSLTVSLEFDNDELVDLLLQLRTALLLCQKSGLGMQVMIQRERGPSYRDSNWQHTSVSVSPQTAAPTFTFDAEFNTNVVRTMFERILSTLDDLVLNDCRYKSSSPKPSRPPYTSQSVIVDIAIVLVDLCDDPFYLYAVGITMLPGFDSFGDLMLLCKLLGFYMDKLIPKLIQCKREGSTTCPSSAAHTYNDNDSHITTNRQHISMAPTINIQSPDNEQSNLDTQRSMQLTIDTRLSAAPLSPSLNSPGNINRASLAYSQPGEAAQAHALFGPLLFFMVQYLNPYIAARTSDIPEPLPFTLSKRSQAIYNFHRALRYMIEQKPDLHLDVLEVISHGAPEVRYRACQILFHYYELSAGHVVVAEDLSPLGYEEEMEILEKAKQRQEFEEERQRQEEQQTDPTFLETMMGANTAALSVAGINRRYRHGIPESSSAALHQRPVVNADQFVESSDEEVEVERHVWYPHMFAEYSKHQAEELVMQVQPVTAGVQAFSTVMHDDINGAYCKECFKIIKGYGLRCHMCKCSVHYGCLANNDMDIMVYVKEGGIQKVVSPQFCHIPMQRRFNNNNNTGSAAVHQEGGGTTSLAGNSSIVNLLGHQFYLVNLFTLMLCAACRLPLWGISHQGYRCITCNRFVHTACLAAAERRRSFDGSNTLALQNCQPYQPLLEKDTRISYDALCENLLDFYGDVIPKAEDDLAGRSFEEVGTMLSILLLQDNIMQCGIVSGCLLVSQESDHPLLSPMTQKSGSLEKDSDRKSVPHVCPILQNGINLCMAYLASGNCRASSFLSTFYRSRHHNLEECVLSKEEYLSHLGAMMKSLTVAGAKSATLKAHQRSFGDIRGHLQVGFLQVESAASPNGGDGGRSEEDDETEACGNDPQEVLDRDTMLSWVMENLRIRSRKVAQILLQHMRNLGLFERHDGSPIVFCEEDDKGSGDSSSRDLEQQPAECIFPVPYAIDCASTVETLINAIEGCLADIDITINECGMLLLVRRCWPDPFMSRYTSERLIQAILSWIFQEDEVLSVLHAEYTSNKQHLPGVRQKRWTQAAQMAFRSKMRGAPDRARQSVSFATSIGLSSGAGSVYVTTRSALRDRYIVRWMATVHDMDPKAYANMVYDVIDRIVEGKREDCVIPGWVDKQDRQRAIGQRFEEFAGHVLKLKTNGLTFTAFDSIFHRWFDKAYSEFEREGLLQGKEPIDAKNLAKLFSSKLPMVKGNTPQPTPDPSSNTVEKLVSLFSTGQEETIDRGLCWLELLMHAGTGIPSNSLAKIARLLVAARVSVKKTSKFVQLLWFQAVNILSVNTSKAVVIDIVGYLNEIMLEEMRESNEEQHPTLDTLHSAQIFIKYSAALVCFAYNCPLSNITELDIVPYIGDHVAKLSQYKRTSVHAEGVAPVQVDETTPIIRCMLEYLQLDQLNVRADVLKMFYALVHWGFGISNKSDFISGCISQLVSAIWEMLLPCYDSVSDIILNLLMKLLSSDPAPFHACVYKVFEDANWEVRYQGLDHLFGLFTKMDAAFQTKWLPMLSYLGPVFSYFVGSIWDKEEYVRIKAIALLRSFQSLHLRSAFRCWEAYFLTASDCQKTQVTKLMLQLNALFPDWQVMQWESLLDVLETKQQSDRTETQPVDILEKYMRSSHVSVPDTSSSTADMDQLAESENAKVLMMALALQMLSNHLAIDTAQVSRLKFILVSMIGFQNCQRYSTAGEWVVSFDNLSFEPDDPLQSACMISCSRGLKKVMDSFAPLPAETVAAMASEVLERNRLELTENSSPGVHFIDVVLKMFNSGIDFTKMSHLLLRNWLETVLIVVYKHNILDRTYEYSVVSSMKQIIDLLTKEISEENKLLILEILKCLLKRSDHLTAMVLSKQIMALGKLMTRIGSQKGDPVFLKAKEFLKAAFLRFAVAGLFVLMFKNQTVSDDNNSRDVDLFFVLRTVIDPEDIVPDEDTNHIVYLRDQPVRDVLDKLMNQQMERDAFSTVLYNMCRYVETVHSHPYSELILSDYAIFLSTLCKHTMGWRRSDWDINPVLTMSAIFVKSHPYHFGILLPAVQLVFKHALQNCTVHPESIVKLLAAYSSISMLPGAPPNNVFADTVLEEVKAGLSSRNRVHKDTLLVLLEVMLWDSRPEHVDWFEAIENTLPGGIKLGQRRRASYFQSSLPDLLEPLVYSLKSPPASQVFTKKEFKTYNTISKLLVTLCLENEDNISRIVRLQKLNETRHCLRLFSWYLLGALREDSSILLQGLMNTEDIIMELLVQTFHTLAAEINSPDPNFLYSATGESMLLSFLVLKTWALLVSQSEARLAPDPTLASSKPTFWMSVWPAIFRLLERVDPKKLAVAGNTGLPIWNLFLSLLQHLFACRSGIVSVYSYDWSSLLDALLEQLSEKYDEAYDPTNTTQFVSLVEFREQAIQVRRMFDTPPVQVPVPTLIDHLLLELRGIMRLQADTLTLQGSSRALLSAIS